MSNRGPFWNLERGLISLCAVVSGSMWYASQAYALDARRFPQVVSAAVLLLSGYFLFGQVAAWRNGTGKHAEAAADEKQADSGAGKVPTLSWPYSLALCLGFVAVTYGFGLGTALFLFVSFCAARLGLRWPMAVTYGALFSLFIWFAFGVLLGVALPDGMVLSLF